MTKRTALASLLALALAAGAAQAQAPDATGHVPGGGNVIGGGLSAMLLGSGDDARLAPKGWPRHPVSPKG